FKVIIEMSLGYQTRALHIQGFSEGYLRQTSWDTHRPMKTILQGKKKLEKGALEGEGKEKLASFDEVKRPMRDTGCRNGR
ncbi:hypothetical protein AVEN_47290-1, partial [Araneus ventricosus]